MAENCIIKIEGLWSQFGEKVIHRDLNLCVHYGEIISLIGGSGSGKTVLLRQIIGLQIPSKGEVTVFGYHLSQTDKATQLKIRRRWGVLFQHGALFSALNVFDNIAVPLRELQTLDQRTIRELVMLKLEMVGLKPVDALKMPAELSGGMIKRVARARSLALEPELLFLDEPTAGLDPVSGKLFIDLMRALHEELGLTIVMITHDLETMAALSDRIAVLADQHLVAIGPLDSVKQIDHPFIQEYFAAHQSNLSTEMN